MSRAGRNGGVAGLDAATAKWSDPMKKGTRGDGSESGAVRRGGRWGVGFPSLSGSSGGPLVAA